MGQDDRLLGIALGVLATFAAGAALVGLRGALHISTVALLLALVVVVVARTTNLTGGLASALMAALSFDFFFTRPYLSLKIDNAVDVQVTLALLAVGLVAGGVSARTLRERRAARSHDMDVEALSRVLDAAGRPSAQDVELSVRAELLTLLSLASCEFTRASVALPELAASGGLPERPQIHRPGGFELPAAGLAVPVVAAGARLGTLVCRPLPGVGVDLKRRRTAVALAHILGLAIVAGSASTRRAANG